MKKSRQLPTGLTVSILFCALIFGCFLLTPKASTLSNPAYPSRVQAEAEKNTNRFIPGGIELSRDRHQINLPSEVLFNEKPEPSESPIESDEIHVRRRTLNLSDPQKLQPPPVGQEHLAIRELVFDLFEDVRLIGKVERLERHHDDRAVYYGSLTNVRGGDFILAYNEGHVAATFNTPGMGSFELRPTGDGGVIASELDLSKLPACNAQYPVSTITGLPDVELAEVRAKAALHQLYAAAPPVEGGTYNGMGQQGGSDEDLTFTTVDVLIVYSQDATAAAGGSGPMGAIIDVTIARANSVFINSEVGLRLRMVRSEEVAHTEVSFGTSLDSITNASGVFSNVPTWRTQSGADLVALITTGGGGVAWVNNGDSNSGFSVNGLDGIESTFIHEIGHNLGCLHDRENDDTITPLYPYSYGWRFTPEGSGQLRTVMAYSPGSSVPYFSNPDVTYMGTPTGVAIGQPLQSNNAEVVRQTKDMVASYRANSGNVPPSVTLNSPSYDDPLKALDNVNLTASASDGDGTIQEVRFYRLMSDADFNFSGTFSTDLGLDNSSPYTGTESASPAGFWTYAAVAEDNSGGISIDTVSVTIAPHYRSTNLSLPAGKTRVNLEAINELGRVVGFGHNGNPNVTNTQAAYWENGAITLLNPLAGDTGAKALAVGQDGEIYGESISSGGTRRAAQWNNSTTPSDISGLIASYTAASALGVDEQNRIYLVDINSDYRRFNNPGSTTASGNVVWEKVATTGVYATGTDYDFTPGAWRALRWNGSNTLLPPVSGFLSSWGFATNRSGAVFGISSPTNGGWSSGTARLTFWAGGSTTAVDLGTLGSAGGVAHGLNDWNEAVGAANDPVDGSLAVIWKGQGSLIKLSDLILPQAGLKREAQVINNRGQIAGTGFDGATQFIFFLDPLPGVNNRYWLANHFTPAELDNTSLTNDDAKPAGDGLSNLEKRAFGLNPRVAATAAERAKLPEATVEEDGRYHIRFRRLRAPRDIEYLPQSSFTLEANSWSTNLFEHVGTTYLDDDYEEVELRTTFPISEQNKAFIRLRLDR